MSVSGYGDRRGDEGGAMPAPIYDTIGRGYTRYRQPDPRWGTQINAALGDARTVINVGAGSGSYEPTDRQVVAVEPSGAMIDQRPPGSAPAILGNAEPLPFADAAFDAAMALLTVHHWPDAGAGLSELQRVSKRQVVLTWDPALFAERMWFVREYLPAVFDRESGLATLDTISEHLDVERVEVLPVAADCTDGVLGAYWARPEAFLDPDVRSAISGMVLLDQALVDTAIERLRTDLDSGRWERDHPELLASIELDLGYRLVVAQ